MSVSEISKDDIILRLEDVSKVYSGIVAVKRANLELRRGAVNVLVGENGAGKSTLMKIIAGVERPTLGKIILDGEQVSFDSPADAQAHGIGMIFQGSPHERCLPANLFFRVDVCAARDQKLERRDVAGPRDGHQRRLTTGIGGIGIDTRTQEGIDHGRVAVLAGYVERRDTIAGRNIGFGSCLKQCPDHVQIALACSPMQRRHSIGLRGV